MRPRIRAWRSAALVLAAGCGLSVGAFMLPGGTAPAFAACEARSAEQMRAEADATAAGTIVAIERPGLPFGLGTPQGERYWLEITQVYDGDVHEIIQVESSGGYGLDLPAEGRSYLLFLQGVSPTFSSGACSSIPLPIAESSSADSVSGWEWTVPQPGGADLPRAGIPWMPIGFGAVVAVMAVLVVRDTRRARKHSAARDIVEV